MSLIKMQFLSRALFGFTEITVLLPPPFDDMNDERSFGEIYQTPNKFKTLFLLHGACADSSSWLLNSRIQSYAAQHNLAVVLPSVDNSFYANLEHGLAYWDFVSEELPRYVRSILPLSEKREDNFVAGYSMGGYGAFKLGLNKPDHFAAAISLSGVMDIVSAFKNPILPVFNINNYFGSFENLKGSYNDLFTQIQSLKANGASLPRLYMACGKDDFLYDMNVGFGDFLNRNSIDFTFEEGPGAHDWNFWDEYIQKALSWLEI